jgi:hypothetical protein
MSDAGEQLSDALGAAQAAAELLSPGEEQRLVLDALAAAEPRSSDRAAVRAVIEGACRQLFALPLRSHPILEALAATVNATFTGAAGPLAKLPDLSRPAVLLLATRDRPKAQPIEGLLFVTPEDEEDETLEEEDESEDDLDELLARPAPPEADAWLSQADDNTEFEALDEELGAALEEAAAARDPLAVFDAPGALVGVDTTQGQPMGLREVRAEWVVASCDTLGSLARDRGFLPMVERPLFEERILAYVDSILCVESECFEPLVASGLASLERGDPWASWGPIFALGCIEGREPLRAMGHIIERLPPGDFDRVGVVSEALAVAPHPDLSQLARALSQSRNPAARAVGLDLYDRRKGPDPERLAAALDDPNAVVVHAALRALLRASQPLVELRPALAARLWHPVSAVSLAAARLLLLWGDRTPYESVRRGDALPLTGLAAMLEIFVMAGERDDLGRMEKMVRRFGPSAKVLDAIARFGHPRTWAYLMHVLGRDDHAEDAAKALETLFGPLVAREERFEGGAWRRALVAARFDEGQRYWRGEPWNAVTLLDVCMSGELSRVATARRVDELRTRCHVYQPVDLVGWSPVPEAQIASLREATQADVRRAQVGAWS